MQMIKSLLLKFRKNCKSKGGFTLVEIVVALALFAILGGMVTAMYFGFSSQMQSAKNFEKEKNVVIEQFEAMPSEYIKMFREGESIILGKDGAKAELIKVESVTKKISLPNSDEKSDLSGKNCTFRAVGGGLKFIVFISDEELQKK